MATTTGKKKTALVVEGGGMRGIFTAGVLDYFMEKKFAPFDEYYGVSAGSCNLASHLGGQYRRNYNCYAEYMLMDEFFSMRKYFAGGHFMDLDWLWDYLSIKEPLNARKASKSKLFVVTTDVDTGEPAYIRAENDSLAEYLKASSSLPLLYRGFVEIEGRRFVDGGIADPIPVMQAAQNGAKRIMVLRTRPAGYIKKSFTESRLIPLLFPKYPNLQKAMKQRDEKYNRSLEYISNPPKGIDVIHICPNGMKTGRTTKDKNLIDDDYELGRKAGEEAMKKWKM